jgi:hypothetical protein
LGRTIVRCGDGAPSRTGLQPGHGHTGGAAGTGVHALPRPFGMVFTDPTAVLAEQAIHGWASSVNRPARRASISQSKFGRTSAPFVPQTWQVNRGSISDNRTSSGHLSPLIAVQWLHLKSLSRPSSSKQGHCGDEQEAQSSGRDVKSLHDVHEESPDAQRSTIRPKSGAVCTTFVLGSPLIAV